MPQDSGVGLGARKLELLGGPQDPVPSSFNAEEGAGPEFTPGSRLGWGTGEAREGELFPFPRVDVRGRVG